MVKPALCRERVSARSAGKPGIYFKAILNRKLPEIFPAIFRLDAPLPGHADARCPKICLSPLLCIPSDARAPCHSGRGPGGHRVRLPLPNLMSSDSPRSHIPAGSLAHSPTSMPMHPGRRQCAAVADVRVPLNQSPAVLLWPPGVLTARSSRAGGFRTGWSARSSPPAMMSSPCAQVAGSPPFPRGWNFIPGVRPRHAFPFWPPHDRPVVSPVCVASAEPPDIVARAISRHPVPPTTLPNRRASGPSGCRFPVPMVSGSASRQPGPVEFWSRTEANRSRPPCSPFPELSGANRPNRTMSEHAAPSWFPFPLTGGTLFLCAEECRTARPAVVPPDFEFLPIVQGKCPCGQSAQDRRNRAFAQSNPEVLEDDACAHEMDLQADAANPLPCAPSMAQSDPPFCSGDNRDCAVGAHRKQRRRPPARRQSALRPAQNWRWFSRDFPCFMARISLSGAFPCSCIVL